MLKGHVIIQPLQSGSASVSAKEHQSALQLDAPRPVDYWPFFEIWRLITLTLFLGQRGSEKIESSHTHIASGQSRY